MSLDRITWTHYDIYPDCSSGHDYGNKDNVACAGNWTKRPLQPGVGLQGSQGTGGLVAASGSSSLPELVTNELMARQLLALASNQRNKGLLLAEFPLPCLLPKAGCSSWAPSALGHSKPIHTYSQRSFISINRTKRHIIPKIRQQLLNIWHHRLPFIFHPPTP